MGTRGYPIKIWVENGQRKKPNGKKGYPLGTQKYQWVYLGYIKDRGYIDRISILK